MNRRLGAVSVCVLAASISACADPPGEISRDTQPFDRIAATASISALGTEPFWGMDIEPTDAGFTARYSTPENVEGTAFSVTRFAGNNGISFAGELEGGDVQIAITPGECSDQMSDRLYPYTATIALGEDTLLGCAYTSDEPFTGEETP